MAVDVNVFWYPTGAGALADEFGWNSLVAARADHAWRSRRSDFSSTQRWERVAPEVENGAWYVSTQPGGLVECLLCLVDFSQEQSFDDVLPAELRDSLGTVGTLALRVEHDGGAIFVAGHATTLEALRHRIAALRRLADLGLVVE